MTRFEIDTMSEDELREWVAELVIHLDEMDEIDYFGHEGWRKVIMKEDD